MRPFECAGMPYLCAGSGFEGAVMRDGSHVEMIEQGVFHWIHDADLLRIDWPTLSRHACGMARLG